VINCPIDIPLGQFALMELSKNEHFDIVFSTCVIHFYSFLLMPLCRVLNKTVEFQGVQYFYIQKRNGINNQFVFNWPEIPIDGTPQRLF